MADILREKVGLIEVQRDDAIALLDKADRALVEAKQEIAGLKRDNDELRQQIQSVQPASDLPAEAIKILKFYFEKDASFTPEYMARVFQKHPSVIKHHIDVLVSNDLLIVTSMVVFPGSPVGYGITENGRAFIVENGLA